MWGEVYIVLGMKGCLGGGGGKVQQLVWRSLIYDLLCCMFIIRLKLIGANDRIVKKYTILERVK